MTIVTEQIYSNYLNKSIDYHLLNATNTSHEAYILYVQDGRDYLELGGLEKVYQNLLQHEKRLAQKLVIVLITPGSSEDRWHSYHRNGKYFSNYITFMNEELIPKVEQDVEKSTIKIVKRGLLGDSLGGNISLNIAMSNPMLWSHLLLQSAAVSKEDVEAIRNLQHTNWSIYQTVGLYEDEFVSPITNKKLHILTRNRELYSAFLNKRNNKIRYTEQKEHHLWEFWKRDLPHAIHYFMCNP